MHPMQSRRDFLAGLSVASAAGRRTLRELAGVRSRGHGPLLNAAPARVGLHPIELQCAPRRGHRLALPERAQARAEGVSWDRATFVVVLGLDPSTHTSRRAHWLGAKRWALGSSPSATDIYLTSLAAELEGDF